MGRAFASASANGSDEVGWVQSRFRLPPPRASAAIFHISHSSDLRPVLSAHSIPDRRCTLLLLSCQGSWLRGSNDLRGYFVTARRALRAASRLCFGVSLGEGAIVCHAEGLGDDGAQWEMETCGNVEREEETDRSRAGGKNVAFTTRPYERRQGGRAIAATGRRRQRFRTE
ncbi:hypothetical protein SKAU_G00058740 [Synaphobranchus kaupii]|uniref:Uncharacterized protein n=1 Tax=Synaphobranchus kaupii TaxID=118154 RepID=A0A9Q1G5I7_SYNKA|nr:hypothetical protein SKAU_G00058740 [Synaphobranchus kaupii]